MAESQKRDERCRPSSQDHSIQLFTDALEQASTKEFVVRQGKKARHIPGCLNVMANLLSRSNQVQSSKWSLHPQVFKKICLKLFTPHVDLFATQQNHKLPLYVSPVPDPNACDIDALNITGRASLPMLTLPWLSFTG